MDIGKKREQNGIRFWMRIQVLMAASMKMTIFWVVVLCSLVQVYRRFRDACGFHHQGNE
jgi:hypothetical protein